MHEEDAIIAFDPNEGHQPVEKLVERLRVQHLRDLKRLFRWLRLRLGLGIGRVPVAEDLDLSRVDDRVPGQEGLDLFVDVQEVDVDRNDPELAGSKRDEKLSLLSEKVKVVFKICIRMYQKVS